VVPFVVPIWAKLSQRGRTQRASESHTFGTRCAAAGVPLRTIQEWLGHRDFKTTLIYADYAPSQHEAEMIERAFSGPRSWD